jgi:hypothetical protein
MVWTRPWRWATCFETNDNKHLGMTEEAVGGCLGLRAPLSKRLTTQILSGETLTSACEVFPGVGFCQQPTTYHFLLAGKMSSKMGQQPRLYLTPDYMQ